MKSLPGNTFSLRLFHRGACSFGLRSGVFMGLLLSTATLLAADYQFRDPLSQPALFSQSPQTQPAFAVAEAGTRLVAVGPRGMILVSEDKGTSWHQSPVGVSSDLTSVYFINGQKGWAAGHDGVILHSEDGGESWVKQLDGRQAEYEFIQHYKRRVDAGQLGYQRYLDELAANFRSGPSLPYLGIWFENEMVGYALGSFGMLVATFDGGKSWKPWLDRIDNPQALNLNAVRAIDGELYLVGERGAVFRLDRSQGRFVSLPTGYQGSFFGITGGSGVLLAFGLRGSVWRSADSGRSWNRVESGVTGSISDGDSSADGRKVLLVSATGDVVESLDAGLSFHSLTVPPKAYTGARLLPGSAVLATLQGIYLLPLNP
ncbi:MULTISPECIES: YCF48-related protein [unclassified Pseudomonas]|uniref:YCF48-related protein n=1 Tax=unclassified Pseudomonas TaxID=196821 RepID=UPI0024579A5A|nr:MULTISPECIES: YCF48-related protein [unclassified Pseudomonas]